MRWLVRAASAAEAQSLADRVKKCIEFVPVPPSIHSVPINCSRAGALATDCKVEIDDTEHGLFDLRQNTGLGPDRQNFISKIEDLTSSSRGKLR
jgi:hypothetical protein